MPASSTTTRPYYLFLFFPASLRFCPKWVCPPDISARTDDKDPRYAGLFLEPSDGLEPSTPPDHAGGFAVSLGIRLRLQAFCKHWASAAMSSCSA